MAESERETSTELDLSGPARLALKLGSGAHAGVYRATGVEMYPTYDDYQKKTEREIPLLVLRPVR